MSVSIFHRFQDISFLVCRCVCSEQSLTILSPKLVIKNKLYDCGAPELKEFCQILEKNEILKTDNQQKLKKKSDQKLSPVISFKIVKIASFCCYCCFKMKIRSLRLQTR